MSPDTIIAGLSSGLALTIVTGFFTLRQQSKNIKAQREAEERADARAKEAAKEASIEELKKSMDEIIRALRAEVDSLAKTTLNALQASYEDRLLHTGARLKAHAQANGYISIDEQRSFLTMHKIYHAPQPDGLGANGTLDTLLADVKALQTK